MSTRWTGARPRRREDITVDDGSGPRTASLASSFNPGAWLHFPVAVPAGGSIVVKAVNKAGGSSTTAHLAACSWADPEARSRDSGYGWASVARTAW